MITKENIEKKIKDTKAHVEGIEKNIRTAERQRNEINQIEGALYIQKHKSQGELRAYEKLLKEMEPTAPEEQKKDL